MWGSILKGIGKVGGSLLGLGGGANEDDIADKVLRGIGAVGPVLSGAAQGSAGQRMDEGQLGLGYANAQGQQARDRFSSDLAGANAQFGAGMQGAQFNREGQDRERKNALLSSLLGGLQDFQATPGNPAIAAKMGTSTGGLRPSALTGNKEALMALLAQPQTAAPDYMAPSPYVAPALPQMPQAGMGEKVLGGIGLGGSILGALGQWRNPGGQAQLPNSGGSRIAGLIAPPRRVT